MNIIVVDDEIASLNTFLENILDVYDVKYKMFQKNISMSIDFVKDNKVDAAFLDINMEEMDGVELAKAIVEASPSTLIVFISGYAQDETKIKEELKSNLVGFCYKPYNQDKLTNFVSEIFEKITSSRQIYFKTFGSFDLLLDGNVVKFSSTKSKELLAFLVDRQCATVTMGEVIANIWSEKDPEHAKRLYRDAVCRLRMTLNENRISDIVQFGWAQLRVDATNIKCDSWDYLTNVNNDYNGEYLCTYDWSVDTQNLLDKKRRANKKK
ncbi:MAG: response regulator [Clostridia bacterium]